MHCTKSRFCTDQRSSWETFEMCKIHYIALKNLVYCYLSAALIPVVSPLPHRTSGNQSCKLSSFWEYMAPTNVRTRYWHSHGYGSLPPLHSNSIKGLFMATSA